jgi:hypothetical protein
MAQAAISSGVLAHNFGVEQSCQDEQVTFSDHIPPVPGLIAI